MMKKLIRSLLIVFIIGLSIRFFVILPMCFYSDVSYNQSCTVLIETEKKNFFGTFYSIGSGVIVDSNGLIITAKHVVEKVEKIQVTVYNKVYDVNEVYLSPDLDIAKIKLNINTSKFVSIGDSKDLDKWDFVYSIGNAKGIWDNKLSMGRVYKNHFKRMFFGGGDYIFTKLYSSPGCSGGGVYRGKYLIGIVISGIKNEAVTFVLSSDEIQDFLEKPTPPVLVGSNKIKEK